MKKKKSIGNYLLKLIHDFLWVFVGGLVRKKDIPEEVVGKKEGIFLPVKLRVGEEEE